MKKPSPENRSLFRICPICGEPLVQCKPTKTYCSTACRRLAWSLRKWIDERWRTEGPKPKPTCGEHTVIEAQQRKQLC